MHTGGAECIEVAEMFCAVEVGSFVRRELHAQVGA